MDSLALTFVENFVVLAAQTNSCLIYQMNMTKRGRTNQRTNQEPIQGVREPTATGKGSRIQAGKKYKIKTKTPKKTKTSTCRGGEACVPS